MSPSSGAPAPATGDGRPGAHVTEAAAATAEDRAAAAERAAEARAAADRAAADQAAAERATAERRAAEREAADRAAAERTAAEKAARDEETARQAAADAAAAQQAAEARAAAERAAAEKAAAERAAEEKAAEEKAAQERAARTAAAAALVAPPPPARPAAPVAPQQPAAVKPGTPQAPRKPRPTPKADEAPPAPGDLICGSCGAGNAPTRKFCRRCGTSLADAPVAQRRSWWSRLWRPDPKAARAAGYRPPRRRRFPTRPVVAIVVIGAIVAAVLAFRPEIERARISVLDRIQGNTAVNPTQIAASSELPERPARQIRDGATNLPWSPAAPGDGVGQFVDMAFAQPFRLTRVLVIPGSSDVEKDYLAGSSPRVLTLTATTSAGTQQTVELPLADRVGLQSVATAIDDVVAVRLTISSTYRATPETHVAIAEVEFRGRS
ncbi:zinc ribbon domain-containing protein [Cellulomonas fimi]|uniref:NADase-type glycan-binding domain-containing protein n=1 Tax=Cellulomonas fimi TaxID=1708 RepID=UPI00234C3187|nr:zinc ribbon domain-containing protein [Cellulomonas fimi]MDC7122810.1 zinc ribbon domain-containing protein [Cellulomonas fimi]